MFIIGGLQKTSLIDFPQKVAAIVFTKGCNFRCGYCHNPELFEYHNLSDFDANDFYNFLKTRVGKLDGVVITGGEPTLQPGLYDFIKKIKSLGFSVKLDTNGTNPIILKKLFNENMLDYLAMDIKSPLNKYNEITGVNVDTEKIQKSIELIMNSSVDYEFRTTVVKSQLSFNDFDKIGKLIKGAKLYYLQKFMPTKLYNEDFRFETTYSDEQFEEILFNLRTYVDVALLR